MLLLYNTGLRIYYLLILIFSAFNKKAALWVKGRRNINYQHFDQSIWFHFASLGEFEQGKPVIEKIKQQFPGIKLLITFFSPSGYEVKKSYAGADYVFYMPMDSKRNARKFLDIVNPTLVIFIKYDYWYHYLNEIKKRKINCLLVSAVFRQNQVFFKWYGSLQRKMLSCFTQVFVQDERSRKLLETINLDHRCIVAGDTRFDTVTKIAEKFEVIPQVETFIHGKKTIVAGSTWKKDEEMLQIALNKIASSDIKLIVAPHEINNAHLDELKKLFPVSIRFSELTRDPSLATNILIIDNIGMLSRLYKYGYLTYVGGGFTKDGVHNVLEAAVYGKPVLFGSTYGKYKEAIDLIKAGGAASFSDPGELCEIFMNLLENKKEYEAGCRASKSYVWENKGATEKVLDYIEINRLLTR